MVQMSNKVELRYRRKKKKKKKDFRTRPLKLRMIIVNLPREDLYELANKTDCGKHH